MNTNHRNTVTQMNARQQGYARRAAAAPAGYTTYEGGDFRSVHSAYEPRPARAERIDVTDHAARNQRTARAAQTAEAREIRIPRGEREVQASAEPREVHPRQGRASRNGGSGNRGGRNRRGSNGKGGKRKVAIALILVVLLVAGFGIWKAANLTPDEATGGAFYDQSASQIQEAIDHEVKDGYFNMSINTSVPVFEDNSAALGIKNIESNQYDCTVTVTLDDGREVYKSAGLAPGTELEMVTLTQTLEPGDHEATAVFDIYEQDEAHTVAGQTASKLTLHVL